MEEWTQYGLRLKFGVAEDGDKREVRLDAAGPGRLKCTGERLGELVECGVGVV